VLFRELDGSDQLINHPNFPHIYENPSSQRLQLHCDGYVERQTLEENPLVVDNRFLAHPESRNVAYIVRLENLAVWRSYEDC